MSRQFANHGAAKFVGDGRYLVTANGQQIQFWESSTGKLDGTIRNPFWIEAIEVGGGGRWILAVPTFGKKNRTAIVWDVRSRLRKAQLIAPSWDRSLVAFDTQGQLVAAVGRDKRIRIWRLADKTAIGFIESG